MDNEKNTQVVENEATAIPEVAEEITAPKKESRCLIYDILIIVALLALGVGAALPAFTFAGSPVKEVAALGAFSFIEIDGYGIYVILAVCLAFGCYGANRDRLMVIPGLVCAYVMYKFVADVLGNGLLEIGAFGYGAYMMIAGLVIVLVLPFISPMRKAKALFRPRKDSF